VLRDQASDLARASGASPDQLKRILDAHHALIEAIRAGAGPDVLATDVRALARAQIEALPDAQRPPADQIDAIIDRQMPAQLKTMQSRWMRFFVSFDPAPTLERVHCPVLALFGGKDMQVPPATNRAPLEAALARGGNRRVTVKVYPEANHLFIKAVTGNPAEYPTLEKVFVPGLVDDVAGWVTAVTRQPAGPL
jgi:pimeloyl-ACP methyl ester carboxylesterase